LRLFGKHIFRSIRSAPLQPIMIVIIVMLSTAVTVLSVSLPINIHKNETEALGVDGWSADIIISLRQTSDERLIFSEDVSEAVGERGRVLGEFSLVGFYSPSDTADSELINIGAFGLRDADAFYELRYLEYGNFTNKNLDSSAIVSASFAEENGISLGDTVTISVLGRDFSYTVEAIAMDTGILRQRSVLVDISSVRHALAERSPLIASLSSEFDPYTKIHIKANEGVDLSELKNELESKEMFANTRIELVSESAKNGSITTILVLTIVMPALLLLMIAVVMALSAFDLLARKRLADIALFKMVGAEKKHLNLMLYLESTVYGVLGGILGCALYIPVMYWLNEVYGFEYSRMRFGAPQLLLGMGFALLFAALCTALHIRRDTRASALGAIAQTAFDTERRLSARRLLLLLPAAILGIITLFLSPRDRYITALALTFSLVLLLYFIAPYIMGAFAGACDRLLALRRRFAGNLTLAAKSLMNSYPLRHAGRVVTLLITVCASISVILSATYAQLDDYLAFESFDMVGFNADDKTKSMLSGLDGVCATAEAVTGRNMVFECGKAISAVSIKGDVDACFDGSMLPEKLPTGDNIALSSGAARMLGLREGDRVKCTVSDISCELTVAEIFPERNGMAYYDADYVGSGYDTLCILTDGTQAAREEITALFDERGVQIAEGEALVSKAYDRVKPQLTVFVAMFFVMVFLTAFGIFNILTSQRRARECELAIMMQNGMSKRGVVALQLAEIVYILVCAALLSLPYSFMICHAIDTAAVSFGITMFP